MQSCDNKTINEVTARWRKSKTLSRKENYNRDKGSQIAQMPSY